MGLGATGCNHLVAKLARQWEVRKTIAVHVAHLLPAESVFGATEAVWDGDHAGP